MNERNSGPPNKLWMCINFLEGTVEKVRSVTHERVQRIDEQIVDVPIPQITEETGEEIVDVSVPPVDAIEALQLLVCATSNEIQRKYFDMFSGQEEFLTKIHELRMQLDAHFKTLDVLRVRKIKGP